MALFAKRSFSECLLDLKTPTEEQTSFNHIFEPEFHQDVYRGAGESAKKAKDSFQLGDLKIVQKSPNRGIQPTYVDDELDPSTLVYKGMIDRVGKPLSDSITDNVCALKSISVRWGFLDFESARAVKKDFFQKTKARASVLKNDLLINSTGDGTIGRVAIYNRDHEAMVDGHITIVRFKKASLAWYVAAYLLSDQGQNQIYRYINGSSGQVEIYPQDIERLWIPGKTDDQVNRIAKTLKAAVDKYEKFQSEMAAALDLAK